MVQFVPYPHPPHHHHSSKWEERNFHFLFAPSLAIYNKHCGQVEWRYNSLTWRGCGLQWNSWPPICPVATIDIHVHGSGTRCIRHCKADEWRWLSIEWAVADHKSESCTFIGKFLGKCWQQVWSRNFEKPAMLGILWLKGKNCWS